MKAHKDAGKSQRVFWGQKKRLANAKRARDAYKEHEVMLFFVTIICYFIIFVRGVYMSVYNFRF